MGRHSIATGRKPFFTYRRAIVLAAASLALTMLGFAVREAEANQIGSTSTASTWTFFAAGLCLYAATFIAWMKRRVSRRRPKGD